LRDGATRVGAEFAALSANPRRRGREAYFRSSKREPSTRWGVLLLIVPGERGTRARYFANAGVVCLVHTSSPLADRVCDPDSGAVA
jgi:hypothetical protein